MSDYTKGPWSVGRMLDPKDAPAIIGDEDSVVAILPGKWNHCSYIEADARLIAAAPELLAELQNIANAKRFDRDAFENDTAFVEWARSRCRYVIAKATGATP